jgi:hypothetical protein
MSLHQSVGHFRNKKICNNSSLNTAKFKFSGTAINQNFSHEKVASRHRLETVNDLRHSFQKHIVPLLSENVNIKIQTYLFCVGV